MSTPTQGAVATRIRIELAARHESQRWLASRLKWSEMKLSSRMTGRVPFDTNEIDLIADAFGIEFIEFFEGMPA